MKILLFALCGSYSHTCLAIRCLREPLEKSGYETELLEGNLRDRASVLLHKLYVADADIYSFSCYIWNIEESLSLAKELKALRPNCRIIFGGPEVSFDNDRFDMCYFIDAIVCGEGEGVIAKLCRELSEGKLSKRIWHAEGGVTLTQGALYREGELCDTGRDLVYYESSRGCPFSCSYCLSSAMSGVRAKSSEQTLEELLEFESICGKASVIKFVDRTFNFDIKRANEIWRGLLDEKYTKKYHFEVCASLLDEESFDILSLAPAGKFQLEVGLQSANGKTLSEVARHLDTEKTLENCRRIKEMGNVHLHLDLIAGLPYEDFDSFARSFDLAYPACHKLQLGFLKLLHGTALRRDAEKYGYKFSASPPYRVLANNYITYEELYELEKISYLLERFHESGNFEGCIDFAVKKHGSPFVFYKGFSDHITAQDGREIQKISQRDAFSLLYSYASGFLSPYDLDIFLDLMHEDFSKKEVRKLPLSAMNKGR